MSIYTDNIRPHLAFDDTIVSLLMMILLIQLTEKEGECKKNTDDIVIAIDGYTRELNKINSGLVQVEYTHKYINRLEDLKIKIDEVKHHLTNNKG